MSDVSDLQKRGIDFRHDRDWKQFLNAKDLEYSLWKSSDDISYMDFHYQGCTLSFSATYN
jgi:hypothetical protein